MTKKIIALLVVTCLLTDSLGAQTDSPSRNYRNFPIVISLQFHSLGLPFKDIGANFANVGIGLGTEVSYTGRSNWVQQVSAVWYRNRAVGNGLLFYTQAAWRPTIVSNGYAEVKAGIGYLFSFRPVESYKRVNDRWVSAGHKGKGMLALPVGVSVGYEAYSAQTCLSPFISYQFMLLSGYNKSIPLIPETLLQAGARIHTE